MSINPGSHHFLDTYEIALACRLVAATSNHELKSQLAALRNRHTDAVDRFKLFSDPSASSSRHEAYYEFEKLYGQTGPKEWPWAKVRQLAESQARFDAKSHSEKLEAYLAYSSDYMLDMLRQQQADDIMFVPLRAAFLPYGETKNGDSAPKRSRRLLLVDRLTTSHEPLLVLRGLPGSGKSVALRQMIKAIAEKQHGRKNPSVPILIPLGQIAHSRRARGDTIDVLSAITGYLENLLLPQSSDFGIAANYIGRVLSDLLQEGRCIIAFDGMDELPREGYDEICRALIQFSRRWGRENRFIISCREFDYPKEFNIHSLIILPFEWPDVTLFLRSHLAHGELARRLVETKALWDMHSASRGMFDNPFFLHLVCEHVRQHPNEPLPITRGPLFREYVARVLRRTDGREQDRRLSMQRLSYWITVRKASGTSATWDDLDTSQEGQAIAHLLDGFSEDSQTRNFIERSDKAVTFRHHKLREYFAAEYLAMSLQTAEDCAPFLQSILDDVWYYETIVLLASLLSGDKATALVRVLLATQTPYRATLAAECAESANLPPDSRVSTDIFDALKICITSRETRADEKVECWQALNRLRAGGIRLGELGEMFDDQSRFVREEAIKAVARLTDQSVPSCYRPARKLILAAAKVGSLARIWAYFDWAFSPALRNAPNTLLISMCAIVVAALWATPLPLSVVASAYYGPVLVQWWTVPAIVGTLLATVEIFLALNPDKRAPYTWLPLVRKTFSLAASQQPLERRRARRALMAASIPFVLISIFIGLSIGEQSSVSLVREKRLAIRKEQQEVSLRKVAQELLRAPPVDHPSFIVVPARNASKDTQRPISAIPQLPSSLSIPEVHEIADALKQYPADINAISALISLKREVTNRLKNDRDLCLRLASELDAFANQLSESTEMNYQTDGSTVSQLLADILANPAASPGSIAKPTILKLRRAKRTSGWTDTAMDYGTYDKEGAKSRWISEQELSLLMDDKWSSHSYVLGLWANNFISEETLERAENADDEAWLKASALALLAAVHDGLRKLPRYQLERKELRAAFDVVSGSVGTGGLRYLVLNEALRPILSSFGNERKLRDFWKARIKGQEADLAEKDAEVHRELARQEFLTEIAVGVVIFLIVALFGFGAYRYLLPRLRMWNLNAKRPEHVDRLLEFAWNGERDSAMRQAAIKALARSDYPSAKEGLEKIASSNLPEDLIISAQRSLYAIKRRQMRRS